MQRDKAKFIGETLFEASVPQPFFVGDRYFFTERITFVDSMAKPPIRNPDWKELDILVSFDDFSNQTRSLFIYISDNLLPLNVLARISLNRIVLLVRDYYKRQENA